MIVFIFFRKEIFSHGIKIYCIALYDGHIIPKPSYRREKERIQEQSKRQLLQSPYLYDKEKTTSKKTYETNNVSI